MFGNLFQEAEGLAVRGSNLQARIDKLAVKVTQLDSNVEEVTLQEIQLRKAFRLVYFNGCPKLYPSMSIKAVRPLYGIHCVLD